MILGAALRLLATPRALAPVGIAIVLGIAWAWHAGQVRQAREAGRAEIRAQWQAERLQAAEVAASAVKAARDIEAARVAALEGIAHDARQEAAAAVAAARRADDAAGRLRQRAAALADAADRCAAAGDPAAAAGGPPAAGPGLVLADMLRRADERAGQLAQYADQARVAGLACERAYGALTAGD